MFVDKEVVKERMLDFFALGVTDGIEALLEFGWC